MQHSNVDVYWEALHCIRVQSFVAYINLRRHYNLQTTMDCPVDEDSRMYLTVHSTFHQRLNGSRPSQKRPKNCAKWLRKPNWNGSVSWNAPRRSERLNIRWRWRWRAKQQKSKKTNDERSRPRRTGPTTGKNSEPSRTPLSKSTAAHCALANSALERERWYFFDNLMDIVDETSSHCVKTLALMRSVRRFLFSDKRNCMRKESWPHTINGQPNSATWAQYMADGIKTLVQQTRPHLRFELSRLGLIMRGISSDWEKSSGFTACVRWEIRSRGRKLNFFHKQHAVTAQKHTRRPNPSGLFLILKNLNGELRGKSKKPDGNKKRELGKVKRNKKRWSKKEEIPFEFGLSAFSSLTQKTAASSKENDDFSFNYSEKWRDKKVNERHKDDVHRDIEQNNNT